MTSPVLHICCNLVSTRLYFNLFRSLSRIGYDQHVLVPHKKNVIPISPDAIDGVSYSYSGHQNLFDRIHFRQKVSKGINFCCNAAPLTEKTVCHAHTLFSDGAIAFELKQRSGVPYLVTVRNTDLNIFWRFFPHLRNYARQILMNARGVIFISPAYKHQMQGLLSESFWKSVEPKINIIPNGLDDYWLKNPVEMRTSSSSREVKVLFVGQFVKNKNIQSLIHACTLLKNGDLDVKLRLVGATAADDERYASHWIDVRPFCKSKEELLAHYRWADVFAMPSFTETFGLVYAEALSQGTPVLFTKMQGFDGWVNDTSCAYGTSPTDIANIADGIRQLHQHSDWQQCKYYSKLFDWSRIADTYASIYERLQ